MTDSSQASWPRFKSEAGRARYAAAYDAALREWPVAHEELDLPTRLGPTHLIASGPADAPPLILLPSFAGGAVAWRLNVEGLSRHFRVYAVDVIGQPGKSRAVRRLRNRRDYADWYVDLLDGLRVGRASVVGCSFGAFLALSQAMLDSGPRRPGGADQSGGKLCRPVVGLRLRHAGQGPRFAAAAPPHAQQARAEPRRSHPPDSPRPPVGQADRRHHGRGPEGQRHQRGGLQPGGAGEGACPDLLLIGDQETLYPPQATLDLARARMPSLKIARVADADHIAAMAQPEAVNGMIIEFLQAAR